jgi:hypothetical protein
MGFLDVLTRIVALVLKSAPLLEKTRKKRFARDLRELHHLIVSVAANADAILSAPYDDGALHVSVAVVEKQARALREIKELLETSGINKVVGIFIKDFYDVEAIVDYKSDMIAIVLASAYGLVSSDEGLEIADRVYRKTQRAFLERGEKPRGLFDGMTIDTLPLGDALKDASRNDSILLFSTKAHVRQLKSQVAALKKNGEALRRFAARRLKAEELHG